MATVRDRGAVTTVRRGRRGAALPSHRPITLSDLITAIQDVVGPEDDALVVATVVHLLRSRGRLIWLRTDSMLRCPSRRQMRPTRPRGSPQPPRPGPRAPCIAVPEAQDRER